MPLLRVYTFRTGSAGLFAFAIWHSYYLSSSLRVNSSVPYLECYLHLTRSWYSVSGLFLLRMHVSSSILLAHSKGGWWTKED